MPIDINAVIPTDFTANVRKQELKVADIRSWPDASLAKVFSYGLQRMLNDAAGAVPTKEEDGVTPREEAAVKAEAFTVAQKVADNLAAGIIRASFVRLGDPVAALAIQMAERAVIATLKSQGKKPGDFDTRSAAKAQVDANPKWKALAQKSIDEAAAIEAPIDLSSLKAATPKAKAAK